MAGDSKEALELEELTRSIRQMELPRIDTRLRRTNMGGSQSMPPLPTSGLLSGQSAGVRRQPSIPRTGTELAQMRQMMGAGGVTHRASFVQSGRMTKVPHYGRLRSVTARVLRMIDPRTLAQRKQKDEQRGATAAGSGSGQMDEGLHGGTAAGVLGRSVVETVRDAAGRRRLRRMSHGSMPAGLIAAGGGLSRRSSRESQTHGRRGRISMDLRRHPGVRQASRQSVGIANDVELERSPSIGTAEAVANVESIIAIPTPGFFLDEASDEWTGGHSFRQRMRYPEEAITVPASLTKRVHYEVSYDYPKNVISTARYNVVTFFPAQLAAQFSKVANIYFLFIAALQQVPGWSTTGRWTTILPLSIFVCLSIAHEGYDDLRRHRMDHAENAQRTRVLKVKVHDRERLSFSFREFRQRRSQSIHSLRMRGSHSIHELSRSTVAGARRWVVSVASIGSTAREAIVSRLAESRRKRRELEDSDDEDEHPADNADADAGTADADGDAAESLLRRRIARGVMSLRSWRGPGAANRAEPAVESSDADVAAQDAMSYAAPRRTAVAFNEEVEERTYDAGEAVDAPLPANMSCRWKRKRWENVQVGDLLMVCKDEWIPADCVVLASTGFDGTCFVETAALDGETTLKQKQALDATNAEIQTAEQLAAFSAFTYVEPASPELYSFEGYMEVDGTRHPLTPNQLLLRGSVLRNTAYVFAQVVYAGEHTRLRLNATRNVRTKAPQIQRITNRIVVLVFGLLLVICVVFAALGIHWNNDNRNGHWYLDTVHMPAAALLFGYIVMLNALIPISLYVTLEAVKIFQCWFIQQDVAMFHAPSNTRAAARTTAINEDLGMVRYVFSDKTGTLTENIMKLRAVMCAGFSYLHIDLDRLQAPLEESKKTDADSPIEAEVTKSSSSPSASHNRTSSRLSFLRAPLSTLQSPLRSQLISSHRRQQSMPVSPAASPPMASVGRVRAQQQVAGSPQHSRGVSTSGLRWTVSPLQSPTSALQHELHAESDAQMSTRSAKRLEEASEGNDTEADDPDVIGNGEPGDPGMHTRADADAPTSDLLRLPSSRNMLGGMAPPPSQVFRSRAEWFLRSMALCHTVQPDRDPLTGRITGYQATSPDEKALVAAAAELGFVMNNRAGPLVQLRVVASERMRDFNRAVVTQPAGAVPRDPTVCAADAQSFDRGVPAPHPSDRLGNYEVLDVLDFSSARKRMSVVLRCPDGRIVMLCKGADSALWPRLCSPAQLKSDAADMTFMPRPPAPTAVPLRRKLSQPSAAYLHSRNGSVASNQGLAISQGAPFSQGHARTTSHGFVDSSLPASRAVPRLSDGRMFFGELGGGSRRSAYSSAAVSPRPLVDSPEGLSDGTQSDGNSSDTPELPVSAPPPALSGAIHRRLVSDSHFSAMSEASSFADTQGQEHIPESFATPTAEEEEWARARSLEALHQFSTEGLRTLVYAHKEIPQAVYDAWHARYLTATTALSGRQQQVEAVCEDLERDLLLTGVSAIEDRLQAGVPETIFKLRRAGVRVWMLTGDKVETAINIAKSCRLIDTEAVEISELDQNVLKNNSGRMMLLVLQSGTSSKDLDHIVTNALDIAREMTATVDQRFERRSRIDKMRRGMKRFGNLLDIRRISKQHKQQKVDNVPLLPPGEETMKGVCSVAVGAERSDDWIRPPTDTEEKSSGVEWAQDIRDSAPTTILGVSSHDPITEISPVTTASRVNQETRSNSIQQKQRLLPIDSSTSESSSHFSDATRSPPACPVPEQLSSDNTRAENGENNASLAVVVDGDTLAALEEHASSGLLDKFLSLGTLCDAVICSRVSPAQKALVVHSMRVRCEGGGNSSKSVNALGHEKPSARRRWNPLNDLFKHDNDRYMVTLAIGDGANDIAMIQEAHVGVGIAGQEGLQASRSADFSIGQFRFLQRLMLVHGRWSYVRVSMFIMGTFYKCMAFYLTQLIFQFYTGFSGTSMFESWTLSMYNTLFSILPVLVVGVFEQDLQPETLLAFPELYRDMGPSNHLFTVPEFIKRVVVIGLVHAIVAAYFPIATNILLGYGGATDDQYILGLVIYSIMVLIVTLKIAYLDMRR
ncbi:hypothetical protein H4S08_003822, partial [Coemansia sp. RSA 1365]